MEAALPQAMYSILTMLELELAIPLNLKLARLVTYLVNMACSKVQQEPAITQIPTSA